MKMYFDKKRLFDAVKSFLEVPYGKNSRWYAVHEPKGNGKVYRGLSLYFEETGYSLHSGRAEGHLYPVTG